MRVAIAMVSVLFGSAAAGCGGSSQGGLTNVPAPANVQQAGTERHDVISNGPESCPPAGTEDPVPHRAAKCPEQPKAGGKTPPR